MILIQISGDIDFLKKVWWLKTIHCGIQQAAGLVEILDLGPVMMAFCTLAYDIKGYNRKKNVL